MSGDFPLGHPSRRNHYFLVVKLNESGAYEGIASLFKDEGVIDFLSDLSEVMRAFLAGDIDRLISGLRDLTGLEKLSGT